MPKKNISIHEGIFLAPRRQVMRPYILVLALVAQTSKGTNTLEALSRKDNLVEMG